MVNSVKKPPRKKKIVISSSIKSLLGGFAVGDGFSGVDVPAWKKFSRVWEKGADSKEESDGLHMVWWAWNNHHSGCDAKTFAKMMSDVPKPTDGKKTKVKADDVSIFDAYVNDSAMGRSGKNSRRFGAIFAWRTLVVLSRLPTNERFTVEDAMSVSSWPKPPRQTRGKPSGNRIARFISAGYKKSSFMAQVKGLEASERHKLPRVGYELLGVTMQVVLRRELLKMRAIFFGPPLTGKLANVDLLRDVNWVRERLEEYHQDSLIRLTSDS